MGYYLQPGSQWKGEYLVFPLGLFEDYDFDEPRRLSELHPVRTMETKRIGPFSFPMKEKYDIMKRTLPLTIIRPAAQLGGGDAADVRNSDDSNGNGGESVPAGIGKDDGVPLSAMPFPTST